MPRPPILGLCAPLLYSLPKPHRVLIGGTGSATVPFISEMGQQGIGGAASPVDRSPASALGQLAGFLDHLSDIRFAPLLIGVVVIAGACLRD
jgi:hypothetical protein